MKTVVLLNGISGSGKTTVCARTVDLAKAAGYAVAGIISHSVFDGSTRVALQADNLATGERRLIAEHVIGGGSTMPAGSWRFHADTFAWGNAALRRSSPCDLLVIDEIGPLELKQGKGWMAAFEVLSGGEFHLAVVVVRPGLADELARRLADLLPTIVPMSESSRDILPEQLLGMVGRT